MKTDLYNPTAKPPASADRPLSKWRLAVGLLRHLGPRWVLFRLRYAFALRAGLLRRRLPLQKWDDIAPVPCHTVWPVAPPLPTAAQSWGAQCVADADAIERGQFVLFSHHRLQLGFPPDWNRNPFTGENPPTDAHFSALGDYAFGDIKTIWESSRGAWAVSLVRAAARTGDPRYAETFWRLFEDWCAHNPPNRGANWKCGQEASFRLMTFSFAVAQFAQAAATTPQRLALFARFVVATGRRVAGNIGYALSQSNNHGLSECAGLLTAGLIAADAPEAARWRESALRHLRAQLDALVYPDGGFSQHSLIYHRVVLHDLLWVIVVLRTAGRDVPPWLLDKTRLALDFLSQLVDPTSGVSPLWGANDGANVLPFDECAFDDLRGVLQAGYAVLDGVRVLPESPADEAALWFTGRDPASFPLRPLDLPAQWHASTSGCFVWRSGESRLFMSCPTRFRHRVVEADMLHVDLLWRGQRVLHDAGSYSYNASDRFAGAFRKAAAHSVPMIAGEEPLRKASHSFYLPWPHGTASLAPDGRKFTATHDAYGARARLERAISSPASDVFVVADHVAVPQPTTIRLHWILADHDWQLDLSAGTLTADLPAGRFTLAWNCSLPPRAVTLVRADEQSARGWWSPRYLAVEPAVSLELLFDVRGSLDVSTRLGPAT